MPHPHWYEQASPEDRREYDAFGPWILEIPSADLMPPAFREAWPVWAGSEVLFKVPVDQDRRSARPGQVLYDRVVALQGDRLGLLTLAGGQVLTRIVPVAQIAAIRSFHLLLRGEFSLFLKGGEEVGFVYNTVSRPLVEQLMDLLRARLRGSGALDSGPGPDAEVRDYAFQNLVRWHRDRSPGLRVAACFEPGVPFREGRWRRRKTSGLLVLAGNRETIFLDTGPSAHRVREAVYASRCTVVPQDSWEGEGTEDGVYTVRAGGHRFSWTLPGGQIPAIWSAPR